MKKTLLISTIICAMFSFSQGQEFPDFTLTGYHQGTATFNFAILPGFSWEVSGTLAQEVQILDDEVFDDGNEFENTYGQADYAENLRLQLIPNGNGTPGQPITSKALLTLTFNDITPSWGWGFCVIDIDVENCVILATDENDNEVSAEEIDSWLIELFDANLGENGENLPKWDTAHAALLGSNTPGYYVTYDTIVIGDMYESEAAAAFFEPDIPLKSLTIRYENLQDVYYTSYHFYIASELATGINENKEMGFAIYPNPAAKEFSVSGLAPKAFGIGVGGTTIEIYELNGRKLLEKPIPAGSEETTIDVSHLQSGLYMCRIRTESGSVTKKLIIQK